MDTKKFAVILTFALTMMFCTLTLPVTYCNDPADPRVRDETHRKWCNGKEVIEHEREVANRKVLNLKWELEDERHAAQLCDWENEHIEHELELKERAEREEDERKRHNMYWAGSKAHQCTTYATEKYTAYLTNVPADYDHWHGLEACKATPLEIHDVSHLQSRYEDKVRSINRAQILF
ncbi:hypothetical protein BDN67DRAFT_983063 [Paxillus ammoniavirescens]|nr:hypothetical protein BDN67DRAFT_983063 [Paxillus ammoniavirescens]